MWLQTTCVALKRDNRIFLVKLVRTLTSCKESLKDFLASAAASLLSLPPTSVRMTSGCKGEEASPFSPSLWVGYE